MADEVDNWQAERGLVLCDGAEKGEKRCDRDLLLSGEDRFISLPGIKVR